MPVRRHEPDRRNRLIDVTLDLIAEVGVAGISHRKIAARAGVPLGSMTYHFDGMDELLFEAFARFAETIIKRFEERLGAATTIDEARNAGISLIHEDLTGPQSARDAVLTSSSTRWQLASLAFARSPANGCAAAGLNSNVILTPIRPTNSTPSSKDLRYIEASTPNRRAAL